MLSPRGGRPRLREGEGEGFARVTQLDEGLGERAGLVAPSQELWADRHPALFRVVPWVQGPSDRLREIRGALWCWGVRNGGQASLISWAWMACTCPVVTVPCPLQDIITALEERLRPLVQAELSVLVDVLHWPELLVLEGSEAYQRCESGGFLSK